MHKGILHMTLDLFSLLECTHIMDECHGLKLLGTTSTHDSPAKTEDNTAHVMHTWEVSGVRSSWAHGFLDNGLKELVRPCLLYYLNIFLQSNYFP